MNDTARDFFSETGARVRPPVIGALMDAAIDNPRLLSLAAGFTDTHSLPVATIGRAVEALNLRNSPPEHLQYGSPQGRRRLRELLSARTTLQDELHSGVIIPARTLVGNGSQQLLYLAMQTLCDPGDIVLVDRPTYFVFLEMLSGLGVSALSLPAHADGSWDFEGIHALLADLKRDGRAARVKALYLMTYFANPSGSSRTVAEKRSLATAFSEANLRLPVIEDAAYRELWFNEPWPAGSVFALDAWSAFPRLYLGTLTKPFASGMKIGYAHCSDRAWLERMTWLKVHHDFGSSNFNQAILEHILDEGGLDEHLARLRPAYLAKMHALSGSLAGAGMRELGWEWEEPAGGLYLWLRAPVGVDTRSPGAFWDLCLREDVIYVPGNLCVAGHDEHRCVRLSFGVLGEDALQEAGRRFARAAQAVSK